MNTVVVQLTGRGVGAISVLLLAGPEAARIVARLAGSGRAGTLDVGGIVHTRLYDAVSTTAASPMELDDALVVRTGADRYELHLHGGLAVVEAVVAALGAADVPAISADEALQRGLLGAPDSLRAELAMALPRAGTMTALRLLAAQAERGLTHWVEMWLQRLAPAQESIESSPASREIWRLCAAAQWLRVRSLALARLLDPPRIAIIGPPNAGKSTLANALLGRPMSITSDLAGTTRDWVDAQAIFVAASSDGPPAELPVTLVDTAGIRDTADPLERESIRRTHGQARAADAIIVLFDATRPIAAAELRIMERYADYAAVVAVNKMDLLAEPPSIPGCPHAILLSAKNHHGLDALMGAVLAQLDLQMIAGDEPFAFTQRQRAILDRLALAPTAASAVPLLHSLVDGRRLD